MTRSSGKSDARNLSERAPTLIPFPSLPNTGEETITSTMGNKVKECDFAVISWEGSFSDILGH